MNSSPETDAASSERRRILDEYERRAREIEPDRYAPWQPSVALARSERSRKAAVLLRKAGVFPGPGSACLEVGFGRGGWLTELLVWGVPLRDLHGIDLDLSAVRAVAGRLETSRLAVADAAEMPWASGSFKLVVASTVFTSILDDGVRRAVAGEIARVLKPGGALLWYDFSFNNPGNRNVRKVSREELGRLFPELSGPVRTVGLAPPIARRVAPLSWLLATALEVVPWARTHLLAVLVKEGNEEARR
ncbi:MAG: class I SAM-dependent methyltransferase [Acidobacteriota bacterium]